MDLDQLHTNLKVYVESVEAHFLKEHLENSLATPAEYKLAVKSYCVLCHAAFEEFTESLCLKVLKFVTDEYKNSKKVSASLITLAHFKDKYSESYFSNKGRTITIDDIEKVFDYNREMFDRIKSLYSKEVFDNHGISLKYLKSLLIPLSIDIPRDANKLNSLQQLVNARGRYAHKFIDNPKINNEIEPEDARNYVNDCLAFFDEIKNNAKNVL